MLSENSEGKQKPGNKAPAYHRQAHKLVPRATNIPNLDVKDNKIKNNHQSSPGRDHYVATTEPEYFNRNEAQEKDLKSNYIKIIEVLKEEIDKP